MEKGSNSLDSSGSADSSLIGLKFGKKIYFEDVGGGGGGGSSADAAAPAKKGKGVVQGGQQPPRCQVEGCKVDLTGAKPYYCRHKVCGMHSKAPKVVVAGLEQRFCQQCSRFHQLPEFDQGKRSCRRRLAGHNERRRKPPPGPPSRFGWLPSSFYEDGGRLGSFLMDFKYPRMPCTARDVWPTVRAGDREAADHWHRNMDAHHGAIPVHDAQHYIQGPTFAPEHQPGHCLAGVTDSSCALSLLSTQPWGSTASRNQASSISADRGFNGTPMAQSVMSIYGSDLWANKGHGANSSSHGNQLETGLGHLTDGCNCQFSGELELALQGNRQCPDNVPSRAYDHTGHGMQWPL